MIFGKFDVLKGSGFVFLIWCIVDEFFYFCFEMGGFLFELHCMRIWKLWWLEGI